MKPSTCRSGSSSKGKLRKEVFESAVGKDVEAIALPGAMLAGVLSKASVLDSRLLTVSVRLCMT